MKIEVLEMSLANALQLADAGVAAIGRGDTSFDLSAVRKCDSSALAVLLAWQRAAIASGRAIEVDAAPEGMLSLAKVYGVGAVLPITLLTPNVAPAATPNAASVPLAARRPNTDDPSSVAH